MSEKHFPGSINWKGILRDIGFDTLNSIHYWRHNLSGNRVRKLYVTPDSERSPVILLQGFMGSRGVLRPLEKYLRSQGRDVLSLDLGFFNVRDIRKSAETLHYKIERLRDRFESTAPFKKIDIVGHSMGGLIGLYFVKKLGGHRMVRRLITLGAPFQGTWASLVGLVPFGLVSKSLWQMLPGSRFLKSLRSHSELVHGTEVISIAAKYDTLCPPKACRLPGATNHIIPVGHASLLVDERVFRTIHDFLDSEVEHRSANTVPFKNPRQNPKK